MFSSYFWRSTRIFFNIYSSKFCVLWLDLIIYEWFVSQYLFFGVFFRKVNVVFLDMMCDKVMRIINSRAFFKFYLFLTAFFLINFLKLLVVLFYYLCSKYICIQLMEEERVTFERPENIDELPIEKQLRDYKLNWPCLQLFRSTMTW